MHDSSSLFQSRQTFRHLNQGICVTLQQRPFLTLFGGLCLLWLLLNLPVLLGVRVLPWDAVNEFYPTVYFNAHTLRMGQAPWWNPYIYAGYPQIADPQGMLFSPLLMAWMLLKSDPGATWFAWGVLLHVLMGGTAMLALLRRSDANDFGALIGATVFMAGGVAASRLEHTPIILAYAYAPVVLLALRYFLAAPGWRRGLLLGAAAGAMVTQLVQVTYLLALMIVGYAIVASMLHWRDYDRSTRWRWLTGMLLAGACALAIGLPQLLFSWSFMNLSNRATLSLGASAAASLDWRALLTLFDPNALHALRGSYSGPADRVEAYLYLGAVPTLLLAGIGSAWPQRNQRRQILFFALVAILAWAYMLGVNGPLYGWLYTWLPGLAQFRRPSDAAFLLNFASAMLAGLAASHFRWDSRRQLRWLLVLATIWLALSCLHMRSRWTNWQAATIVAAAFAAFALHRLRSPARQRHADVWLLALLLLDYRCYNLNGTFNEAHNTPASFRRDAAASMLADRQQASSELLPLRIETEHASAAWDNQVVLHGLYSTQGYNPLRYGLYDEWYGAREMSSKPRVDTLFNPSPASKLSDLLSVGYLVHGVEDDRVMGSPPKGYRRIFADDTTEIWQNSNAYSRLLTPTQALSVTAGNPLTPAAFEATDFSAQLWLTPRNESDRQAGDASASTCPGQLHLESASEAPSRITVRTHADRAAWLVLSELDFPGWVADADGVELPIHRANGMFRAVCVPAGRHTVRLVFHPWTMVADVWRRRAR